MCPAADIGVTTSKCEKFFIFGAFFGWKIMREIATHKEKMYYLRFLLYFGNKNVGGGGEVDFCGI